jgi:DnaJ-domain-containing protein 1
MLNASAQPQTRTVRQHLHDLSQPLTRLQWRLELAQQGSETELRETLRAALAETAEVMEYVRRIRSCIEHAGIEEAQGRAA